MLLEVICVSTSYAKIEMFGNSRKEWMGAFRIKDAKKHPLHVAIAFSHEY